jgi:hypothetical protein
MEKDDHSATSPHRRIVAMLLKVEQAEDAKRKTALDRRLRGAAHAGDAAEVKRLVVDEGAEINAMDIQGITALEWALRGNHVEVVEALMLRGADINRFFPCTAETPLMVAARCGSTACIEFMLPQGAEWSTVSKLTGMTALECAREAGENEAADVLEASAQKQQQERRRKLLHTKSADMEGGRAWNAKIGEGREGSDGAADGRKPSGSKRRSRRGSVERFVDTLKSLKAGGSSSSGAAAGGGGAAPASTAAAAAVSGGGSGKARPRGRRSSVERFVAALKVGKGKDTLAIESGGEGQQTQQQEEQQRGKKKSSPLRRSASVDSDSGQLQ